MLSSALNQAVIDDEIRANPALSTRRVTTKRKKIEVFDPEEANAFLKAATTDRYYILFWLALATGLRPEEYLGLTWPDMNLDKCEARIHQTLLQRKGGGWKFDDVKTEASLRTVSFNKSLARALNGHRRRQNEERLKLGEDYQNNQLVFATTLGTPLQIRNLTLRHFRLILKAAKLNTRMHLYCLRHSYATLSLLAGIDPKVVSGSLGHTRVSFTQDYLSTSASSHESGCCREGRSGVIQLSLIWRCLVLIARSTVLCNELDTHELDTLHPSCPSASKFVCAVSNP